MTAASVAVTDEVARRTIVERRPGHWLARTDAPAVTPAAARQRRAVLGRLVAERAVAAWFAADGRAAGEPGGVRIGRDAAGRPWVRVGGVEPVGLSLAHCGPVAVATVAPVGTPVGIDAEVVEARGPVFARLALTAGELRLGAGDDPEAWVTRAWTVKEAVAKAAGTGLRGRPRDFVVTDVDGAWARACGHWVHTTRDGDLVVSRVCRRG